LVAEPCTLPSTHQRMRHQPLIYPHTYPHAQLGTEKLALDQQVSSLQAASQRLERELAAAAAKAGQQEGQLAELYELCTSQQGGCRAAFD
jgi:hypothetical protein